MVPAADPYRILMVSPTADADTIRAAYRTLARTTHPDVGGSTRAMARLNEAWRTLRDPAARARYDDWRKEVAAARAREAARAHEREACQRHDLHPDPVEPGTTAGSTAAAVPSPPPSRTGDGTLLNYGRYAGWSLAQVAVADPDYLEWLVRTPCGRRFGAEVATLLAGRHHPVASAPPARSRLAFRRR
jgi:curved DNA-binding protein CbpA